MLANLESGRRRGDKIGDAVAAERAAHHPFQRPQRRARRHRIGRVGGDQHGGRLTPSQRALEACGNLDGEEHRARTQKRIQLRLARRDMANVEEGGVAQGRQNGAAHIRILLQKKGGRQITRRRVDGVAKEKELHQRHGDHGGEGDAVAAQLDELLHQHGEKARERTMRAGDDRAHGKLSCARLMRSMKTSSSEGSSARQT